MLFTRHPLLTVKTFQKQSLAEDAFLDWGIAEDAFFRLKDADRFPTRTKTKGMSYMGVHYSAQLFSAGALSALLRDNHGNKCLDLLTDDYDEGNGIGSTKAKND